MTIKEMIEALLRKGLTQTQISKEFGCSKASVCKYLKQTRRSPSHLFYENAMEAYKKHTSNE